MTQLPAPGWYPDGQGNTRYWDGARWIDPYPVQPSGPYGSPGMQPAPPKKRWPWIVGGVVVVLLIVSAIAGAIGSSDDDTGRKATVGPSASVGGTRPSSQASAAAGGSTITVRIDDATADVTITGLSPAQPSILAQPGEHLFGVTVAIEGKSGSFSVNPLYFTARTADGDSYECALGQYNGQLDTTQVRPGQKLRGVVAFDVTAGPIATIIMDRFGGDQLGAWSVR